MSQVEVVQTSQTSKSLWEVIFINCYIFLLLLSRTKECVTLVVALQSQPRSTFPASASIEYHVSVIYSQFRSSFVCSREITTVIWEIAFSSHVRNIPQLVKCFRTIEKEWITPYHRHKHNNQRISHDRRPEILRSRSVCRRRVSGKENEILMRNWCREKKPDDKTTPPMNE